MELSIIVPIYNVENYLRKCLDSILVQTFTDFELILIDDGSPDKCGEIADEYAKKDNRIIVIHQENKGVSAARNAGLKISKGKYIGFVDPDDYIDVDMYSKMYKSAVKNDSEIVCCNFRRISELGEESFIEHHLSEVMNRDEFLSHLFDVPRTVGGSLWNKLFLKKNIHMNFDEELSVCEDWWFLFNYLLGIRKASYVNNGLYYVVSRANSATHTILHKNLMQIEVRRKALELMPKKVLNAAEADFLDTCYYLRNQIKGDYDEKTFNNLKKIYCGYMNKHLLRTLFNKNIFWKTKLFYIKAFMKF